MEKLANKLPEVYETVYKPTFKRACENLGIKFASAEDELNALETVAQLEVLKSQYDNLPPQTPIKVAHDSLNKLFASVTK